MLLQQLSDDELKTALDRAREIAAINAGTSLPLDSIEHYSCAAEEVGIPREAMVQALQEQVPAIAWVPKVGELAFTPSVDGALYLAHVTEVDSDRVKVRFLEGGDHTCSPRDVRPLELLPGRRLQGKLKDWGWHGVKVQSCNTEKGTVHVVHDDWTGLEETLPFSKLRVMVEKPSTGVERAAAQARSLLIRGAAVGMALGGALGYLAAQLLR